MSMDEFRERMKYSESDTSSERGSSKVEEGLEEPIVDDKIFVAVGKDFKENKSTVVWAFQNSGGKEIWIIHVKTPTQAGGKTPTNQAGKEEAIAQDEKERKEMAKALDEYIELCSKFGARAEKLFIEAETIEGGIVTLISQKRIGRLVMGAAAENKYKRNMTELKSMKAIVVQSRAPAFCHIWFVCKGHLVCTRVGVKQESKSMAVVSSNQSDVGRDNYKSRSFAEKKYDIDGLSPSRMSFASSDESNQFGNMSRSRSAHPTSKEVGVVSPFQSTEYRRNESGLLLLPHEERYPSTSSPPNIVERNMNSELCDQLYNVMTQADKLKEEIMEAIHKGKAVENLYHVEQRRRKELEKELVKEEEIEIMKNRHDKIFEELQVALFEKCSLEKEIEKYKKEGHDLETKLDKALSEAEHLRRELAQMDPRATQISNFFADFSYSEIAKATDNFNLSMKIGEGGYGNTYKGLLHHAKVAIKVPKPESLQGAQEFKQEVKVLSRLRHPNIVTLMGVCSEASALIYEYVPNGSLEDRLACKSYSHPLSWQTRTRIACELCSVLIFLQSSQPESIVHGDLKPANVLLDALLSCKLGDFGICRGIYSGKSMADITMLHRTVPKGTFSYMDPQFLMTGELTPKSDVYSYGIILLRLLTGKPAMEVVKKVQDALNAGNLDAVLDHSAGDWPFEQAEQLALLALRCCEMDRRDRPNIADVWKVVEPMSLSVEALH